MQELEGRFIKWNNNAGAVRAHPASPARTGRIPTSVPAASKGLDIIGEEEEEEGSDTDSSEDAKEGQFSGKEEARIEDVPQCFKLLFTLHVRSNRRRESGLRPAGDWNLAAGRNRLAKGFS